MGNGAFRGFVRTALIPVGTAVILVGCGSGMLKHIQLMAADPYIEVGLTDNGGAKIVSTSAGIAHYFTHLDAEALAQETNELRVASGERCVRTSANHGNVTFPLESICFRVTDGDQIHVHVWSASSGWGRPEFNLAVTNDKNALLAGECPPDGSVESKHFTCVSDY